MQWLGAGEIPESLVVAGRNLLAVPRNLLVYADFDAIHWLGHIPILSSFEAIMAILGIIFYLRHVRTNRTRLIITMSAVSWLLIAMIGNTSISLIVPIMYLFAASGIDYLLRQWLGVFPRNPVARSVGVALMMIVIALSSVYQTRSYFVAWRYSSETANAFTMQY